MSHLSVLSTVVQYFRQGGALYVIGVSDTVILSGNDEGEEDDDGARHDGAGQGLATMNCPLFLPFYPYREADRIES